MVGPFCRQFAALFRKNWIILFKHKLSNSLRCFLIPVGYGVLLATAPSIFQRSNDQGIGTPAPIHDLTTQFDGSLTLIWTDGTNSTGNMSAGAIMEHITSGFSDHQMNAIKRVASPADIPFSCPQNLNLVSECYAAVTFNYLPSSHTDKNPINYTITADGGLGYVNVHSHTSDFETRILPLQLAIDKAFVTLRAGRSIPNPLEWPYTRVTNKQQSTAMRLSYIRNVDTLLAVALFTCYIGIVYQLTEAFAAERANLLTSYMKAMGLYDSARIISWHVSMSVAYLPAWIAVALMWHYKIFTETNVGLVLVVHLLLGFSLASWSLFVGALFGNNPKLAAVASTLLALCIAVLAVTFTEAYTEAATIFTLIFPPGYYIFAIRAVCGYENYFMPTDILRPDPVNGLTLFPIMMACIINIFLWPSMGVMLEKVLFDAKEPLGGFWSCFRRRNRQRPYSHPDEMAISVRNLHKIFATSVFSRKNNGPVTVISDLSLDIPKFGIFVLLGPHGSGKSTLLAIIANLLDRSSGSITFEGGVEHPQPGTIGIVPQRDVLFPDLTCYQTLQVWRAIKHYPHSAASNEHEDYGQLLRDCDLGEKIHAGANTLSRGEKRKLQLAIGILGGSQIVLVDECTSGLDPLSRRALWRTLLSLKQDRTIVFTTHSLDEADLLADHVAILAPPGKLLAGGSPASLKLSLGRGYSIQVVFGSGSPCESGPASPSLDILDRIQEVAPHCSLSHSSATHATYHLNFKDVSVVAKVLQLLDDEAGNCRIASVDVRATSIEDIFVNLLETEIRSHAPRKGGKLTHSRAPSISYVLQASSTHPPFALTDARPCSPFSQAWTIFYKRMLITRRSWIAPVLAILTAACGACLPLLFLSGQAPSCSFGLQNETVFPLYLPGLPVDRWLPLTSSILESPPNITATLGRSTMSMATKNIPDNATFISTIERHYLGDDAPIGGVSIDVKTGDSLIAWDAGCPSGLAGPALLNLATNILYNRALNASGHVEGTSSIIMANYAGFPLVAGGTFADLKWIGFFGAAVALYPAFFSLYVSRERRLSIRTMQFSNGLSSPIGLWLGHLLWDSILCVIIATVITVLLSTIFKNFYGLGLFWVVLVLYGLVGALLSYCASLFISTPFKSFIAVAAYQLVGYLLYLTAYVLTLAYAKTSQARQIITIMHLTLSVFFPVASVVRSAVVSANLFSLLCDRSTHVAAHPMGLMRYGGSMLYLSVHSFLLFGVLIWADSGSTLSRRPLKKARKQYSQLDGDPISSKSNKNLRQGDVAKEARAVTRSNDALRVFHIGKSLGGNKVVDDVSFEVPRGSIFALLASSEASRTTLLDMIRGHTFPDLGDIKIDGNSVIESPRQARLALGFCPQFTALDPYLTAREHLRVYGRLKGLARGPELEANVESLIAATSLSMHADQLASRLSRSVQRKLSLAIALIGNPSVVLVDEFSTGFDAKVKRELRGTLRKVGAGRAIVIATHSAEEASALGTKVGIMTKKMQAIGTPEDLVARYATYQVRFLCPTREDAIIAQVLMSRIPGAYLADDFLMRFEVPVRASAWRGRTAGRTRSAYRGEDDGHDGVSLAQVFHVLASQGELMQYTVEKASLESVFVRVVRQHDRVLDETQLASTASLVRTGRAW